MTSDRAAPAGQGRPGQRAIYTVGHSTRSWSEFEELLRDAGAELVADVRAFPTSRRHPQFNAGELEQRLPGANIGYVHLPELGGRRTRAAGSDNAGWRERAFQGYADYMESEEFARGLRKLEELAAQRRTSIMCAEGLWWRCHRRLIADVLTAHGWQVLHLGVGERRAPHMLPSFAVVEDGRLSYPPAQRSLLD